MPRMPRSPWLHPASRNTLVPPGDSSAGRHVGEASFTFCSIIHRLHIHSCTTLPPHPALAMHPAGLHACTRRASCEQRRGSCTKHLGAWTASCWWGRLSSLSWPTGAHPTHAPARPHAQAGTSCRRGAPAADEEGGAHTEHWGRLATAAVTVAWRQHQRAKLTLQPPALASLKPLCWRSALHCLQRDEKVARARNGRCGQQRRQFSGGSGGRGGGGA